jgi:bifunctional oligoribonuclease and PAP phosphatase NrnA
MIANQNSIIENILNLVKSSNNILLSSHAGPDGDSLGSQLAFYLYLKSLGKNVRMYNEGQIPHYFPGIVNVDLVETDPDKWLIPDGGFDLAVIFECTSLDRIGDVSKLINKDMNLINIDHHRENSNFGKYNFVDINASSVGEMSHRIFKQAGFEINPDVAQFLYIAILTDTGRFHYTSTSPESMRVAADLVEAGVDVKNLTDTIYFNSSEAQLRLIGKILSEMEILYDGQVCFLKLLSKDLKRFNLDYSDMEGLVDWTMRIKGVKAGALLKDINNSFTKISLRSQGEINVCELAQKFDGGGHLNASGCHINADLETSREKLLKAVEEMLNK